MHMTNIRPIPQTRRGHIAYTSIIRPNTPKLLGLSYIEVFNIGLFFFYFTIVTLYTYVTLRKKVLKSVLRLSRIYNMESNMVLKELLKILRTLFYLL